MKRIYTNNKDLFVMGKLLKVYGEIKINRKLSKREKTFFEKINAVIDKNNKIILNNPNFEIGLIRK